MEDKEHELEHFFSKKLAEQVDNDDAWDKPDQGIWAQAQTQIPIYSQKKIISKKAIGAIATHDLEVCQTTEIYPDTLTNKCFEVEIINNELDFDYRLRDGICQNKSATFLMEKMGVI